MANSNVTKKVLANALKELIKEKSISKITIKDICLKYDMNRKSFYYHFKDKNDLINWIFDNEVGEIMKRNKSIEAFSEILDYLYENKNFYKKVLRQTDQNCLAEHIKDRLIPIIRKKTQNIPEIKTFNFYVEFMADAIVYSIKKWLIEGGDISGHDFFEQLAACVRYTAIKMVDKQ